MERWKDKKNVSMLSNIYSSNETQVKEINEMENGSSQDVVCSLCFAGYNDLLTRLNKNKSSTAPEENLINGCLEFFLICLLSMSIQCPLLLLASKC